MRPFRFTIAQIMVATAVLAANAGLIRAFLVQEMFEGAILIIFALQVGLWLYLRSRGRWRRFWLGFEVAGWASIVVLFIAELFPDSAPSRLIDAYLWACYNLIQFHFPTSVDDLVMDHQDIFSILIFFLLELAMAVLGGVIALSLTRLWRKPPFRTNIAETAKPPAASLQTEP